MHACTMHSTPLTLGNAMESNVMILRLNALVRQADLRIAILEAIQKMDYNWPSENQALAINHFARGNDVLPTGSGKSLCYAAISGVFDTLKRRANSIQAPFNSSCRFRQQFHYWLSGTYMYIHMNVKYKNTKG